MAALAGLGLLAAALTLAGQDIVLDYLMGILILIEGHYYKGDWIAIRGPLGAVEGEVEDIGLRKTTIRDNAGTVHNVSNGLIRLSSNLTRVYSVASAEVQVLHAEDSTGRSRSRLAWATSCRPTPSGPESCSMRRSRRR